MFSILDDEISVNFRYILLNTEDFCCEWIQKYTFLNPLIANPTKWSNKLKQFVGKLPTNCLSVFDHFVILALKGLMILLYHYILFGYIIYGVYLSSNYFFYYDTSIWEDTDETVTQNMQSSNTPFGNAHACRNSS